MNIGLEAVIRLLWLRAARKEEIFSQIQETYGANPLPRMVDRWTQELAAGKSELDSALSHAWLTDAKKRIRPKGLIESGTWISQKTLAQRLDIYHETII
jgi:hypothetical protein